MDINISRNIINGCNATPMICSIIGENCISKSTKNIIIGINACINGINACWKIAAITLIIGVNKLRILRNGFNKVINCSIAHAWIGFATKVLSIPCIDFTPLLVFALPTSLLKSFICFAGVSASFKVLTNSSIAFITGANSLFAFDIASVISTISPVNSSIIVPAFPKSSISDSVKGNLDNLYHFFICYIL